MKRATTTQAKGFVCIQCVNTIKESDKEISFFDQVKFMKSFCYLGEKLNACNGSARTVRMRIGWIKFRKCR